MKSVLIRIVVITALGAVVFASRNLKPQPAKHGGFREWVKNPEFKQAAEYEFAAREALTIPDNITDAEIRQMVSRLFVKKDDDFNFDRLKLVGAKAVPFLIDALENRNASTKRFSHGYPFGPNSAFERICDLLEPFGPPDAVRPLARYMDHKDDDVRKHAALVLGNIGTVEAIPPTLRALEDEDHYVRSYAMMGIRRGMEAQRCSRDYLNAVFPSLVKLLNRRDGSMSDTAPELLLAIDAERAVSVLLTDQIFTASNPVLGDIIRAMNQADRKIPHTDLLPLLKALRPLVDNYPHGREYAAALIAYAFNPDASADEVFHNELSSSNEDVREGAARALAILAGVTNPSDVVFGRVQKSGFDSLSPAQRHYFAVLIYDGEVRNGGHSQYFVNSSGDHWKDALEGLTAIGAAERAKILRKATSLFGSDGPSEDNSARHGQLAGFKATQDEALDELDPQYYACKENVDFLLSQYVVTHRTEFIAEK